MSKFKPEENEGLGLKVRHNFTGLSRHFVISPFSVLSTMQGDWQKRKRAWLELGIQSEVGRHDNLLKRSEAQFEYMYNKTEYIKNKNKYKKAYTMPNEMQNKTGKYAAKGKKAHNAGVSEKDKKALGVYMATGGSVIDRGSGGRTGTSIFDPVLCELMYTWFCPPGGAQVVDPFAGGSVRGIVASMLGHKYWGCELRKEQVKANREQGAIITPDNRPKWVYGDSLVELTNAPEADFIFSCPPYGDLEVYSEMEADISNKGWDDFLHSYNEIIKLACTRLKPDRFACFVVGNYRDKEGFYHDLVGETVYAFEEQGVRFYNEAILVTPTGSLPIRVTKQFQAGRKLGKTHQNVLVFYKGNPKNIKKLFGSLER